MTLRETLAVLSRALSVQGSWNYETLTGTGFAFVILPSLRRIHGGDPAALDEAVRRHETTFNSHPYLMPVAVGAVIRMEEEGEDPEVIDRFKAALRGALGTMGDQLIWAGWRPVCILAALATLLLGAPWWGVVLSFLVLYNLGHATLVYWGLRVGLRDGRGVAHRLRQTIQTTQPRLMAVGAFLVGVVTVLLVGRGVPWIPFEPDWLWMTLAVIALGIGARWGERARRVAVVAAMGLAVVGVVIGVVA